MQWVDLGQALARIESTDWLYGFELVCGCLERPLFNSAFRYDDDFPEIDQIFNRNYPLARKDLKCNDDLGSARHVTKKACADIAKRMQAVALAKREAYVREEWQALMRAVSEGARHRDGLLCFCFAD